MSDSWRYLGCDVVADVAVAIPLREPTRGALWGSEISRLSGLDMLRAFVEHRLPDPPVARLAPDLGHDCGVVVVGSRVLGRLVV